LQYAVQPMQFVHESSIYMRKGEISFI
jgi:hypothetical protein